MSFRDNDHQRDWANLSLNRQERIVLDLWDAGNGSKAIVEATGFTERRVMQIVSLYDADPHSERLAEQAARAATELLGQRCAELQARMG